MPFIFQAQTSQVQASEFVKQGILVAAIASENSIFDMPKAVFLEKPENRIQAILPVMPGALPREEKAADAAIRKGVGELVKGLPVKVIDTPRISDTFDLMAMKGRKICTVDMELTGEA